MNAFILPSGRPATCHPITLVRDLADCPIANTPLRDLQRAELAAAGYALAEPSPTEPALHLAGNAWADAADLARLRDSQADLLCDPDGHPVAWISPDGHPPANPRVLTVDTALRIVYPWHLLTLNERLLARVTQSDVTSEVHERVTVDGILVVGQGSRILPGVYVEGTVIVGRDCKIGPNAYLRGPTAIGDGVHIGQAVEIKASILMRGAAIGHLSYVGDSIIGENTNFGAGTITANFRHDGKSHRSLVDGKLVDTGRRKFGAIIGDHVHTGIHTSIYPGRKLWPHIATRPGAIVQSDLVD